MAEDVPSDPSLDGLGYAEAVAELEGILEQLDGDEVDVDHLATQVRRAAQLIGFCRSRLSSARMEVTRIVADLDTVAPATPTPGSGSGSSTPAAVGDDLDAPGEVDGHDDDEDEAAELDDAAPPLDDGLFAEGDR